MSEGEFRHCVEEVKPVTDYLYFHLMGEPLLHPDLYTFTDVAAEAGLKVVLTTNGTLLKARGRELLTHRGLHKVSISLHAYEVNVMDMTVDEYLDACFEFCESAAKAGVIAVMRLWNAGGEDSLNPYILERMHAFFTGEWQELYSGYKLCEYVFLEWGERFEWPDKAAAECGSAHSCYGLRDQIGILSDGTVVPCCLDADGAVNLGNIFTDSVNDILTSPRAVALAESFRKRSITESLCKRCDFANKRFNK